MGRFSFKCAKSAPKHVLEMIEKAVSQNGFSYVPARVVEGHRWYVEFYVWDRDGNVLVRRRVYTDKGKTEREKRANGRQLAADINALLAEGMVLKRSGI